MSTKPRKPPSYRLHKPSGQAVVTLNGKDHYLGLHGTEVSKSEYDRIVGLWQANGRRLPEQDGDGGNSPGLTMKELILAYWRHAEIYYRKDGKPTSQLTLIKRVLGVLRESYGNTAAASFGAPDLKAVRQRFIDDKLSRNTCNAHVARIKRMFAWAGEDQLIPESVYHGLLTVKGLKKGRTEAPDHPPVGPVPAEHVEAVVAKVRAPIAAMIRLQDLTGMRPGEVCQLRGCDIDQTGAVWTFRPATHKGEHHGRGRTILIGPQAQEILRPWLGGDPQRYLFRPRPLPESSSRRKRSKPREWHPGDCYSARSYGARIRFACRSLGIPEWHPNRLRHSAGTRIRQQYGLEAAQTVLGHARADVTQVYAERDLAKAREVMAEIG